jgi:hypothetical protein
MSIIFPTGTDRTLPLSVVLSISIPCHSAYISWTHPHPNHFASENGTIMFLYNVGIHLQEYSDTIRRSQSEHLSP